MRIRLRRILGATGLAASLAMAAVPVRASEIKFRVPFDFIVNGEMLPSGTYDVTSERSLLLVRGYGHGAAVVTSRSESRPEREPSLIFNRYGDRYLLVQAWMGGESGRLIPTSPLERELIGRRASAGDTARRIVVPVR